MTSESAAGVINAAPSPWAARVVMRTPALAANPPINEAVVKTIRPMRKTRRRGSRSAIRPPSSKPPPETNR